MNTHLNANTTNSSDDCSAYSIDRFCRRYDIGRSKAYEEIRAGRLKIRKVGTRTLIAHDDATAWFDALPQR